MAFPVARFLVVACFVIGGQGVAAHLSSVIQLCSAVNGSCLSDLECCGQLVCSSLTPGVASCSSTFSKDSHIRVRRQLLPGQPGMVPVFNRLPAGVLNQWQGGNDQQRQLQPVSKEVAGATDRLRRRHRTASVTSSDRQALNRELNEKLGAAAPVGGDEVVAATKKKRGWRRRIGDGFKKAGRKIRTGARNLRDKVRNIKRPHFRGFRRRGGDSRQASVPKSQEPSLKERFDKELKEKTEAQRKKLQLDDDDAQTDQAKGKRKLASRRGKLNKKRGWKTKLRQGATNFRNRISRIRRPRIRLPQFNRPSFSRPQFKRPHFSRPSLAGFRQRFSGWRRPRFGGFRFGGGGFFKGFRGRFG